MKLLLIFVGFETKVLLSFGKKSPCSTRLKLSKLKKDFINREFQHVHLRCKQVPRNESWTLLLQLRVGKKEVRQAYVRTVSLSAGFEPARENPNRFRVCRLNHSATTTWVLILPLSDYICSCISKKWGIERFWSAACISSRGIKFWKVLSFKERILNGSGCPQVNSI